MTFSSRQKVKFLDHQIFAQGIGTDPGKIEAVKQWKIPSTVKAVLLLLYLLQKVH